MLGRFWIVVLLMCGSTAWAQEPFTVSSPVKSLATLLTDLYGPEGLVVDSQATLPGEQAHNAHFTSHFQSNFGQFATAFANQLVSAPKPSPASGFTFEFDPSVGVFHRSTQSFGPILTERAETIGARRVAFGSAFQRFTFNSIDGVDLEKIPAVFEHDNAELLGGRQDVITTTNSIKATVDQFTSFLTLGVTDSFDLSVTVPIVTNDMSVVSHATIQRLGTMNPLTHFFVASNGEVGTERTFTAVGNSAGLGDVTLRMKNTVLRRYGNLAVALDVRLPTGNEMNLLGSGATGLRPFVAWSKTFEKVSPHVNAGYQWNGSSVLAGDPAAGVSGNFPDEITYAAGADLSVNPRLTVVFDVIGRYVIDANRLVRQDFHALNGTSVFPNIVFSRDSFGTMRGAIGAKASFLNNFLVDLNLLFAVDNHGLTDRVTPLIGIEYAF